MKTPHTGIYTDFQGLAELKVRAQKNQSDTLDGVARQFESLLMNMMLKSMREASLGEGLLDSDQSLFYRDMYDQQLALHLAEQGGMGLADVIRQQLAGAATGEESSQPASNPVGRPLVDYRTRPLISWAQRQPAQMAGDHRGVDAASTELVRIEKRARPSSASAADSSAPTEAITIQSPEDFVHKLWPYARQAGDELGLDPKALLAQAALETGWGKSVIRSPNGRNSHNLFGIKADRRWAGEKVMVPTLEFEDGVPVRRQAPFRAYSSFDESFRDYVEFVRSSSRYQQALAVAEDANAYFSQLQQGGYATDPRYAEKISKIINSPRMKSALAQLQNTATRPI